MNEQDSIIHEETPWEPHRAPSDQLKLGDDPAEKVAIPDVMGAVDAILRHPRRVMYQLRQPRAGRLIISMLAVAVGCSLVYGVVVGTFSSGTQLWIAPLKVTLGLMFSAAISLPSLYIFACLSGSEARLKEISGLVAGLLLLMTTLLIGFAPVAWIFSQSTSSIAWMGTLHLCFWFVATFFGLRFLESAFSLSKAKSRAGFYAWAIIFLLVSAQMTTTLRPIIGHADTLLPFEKKFFLNYWDDCLGLTSHNIRTTGWN